jgi:hypothetical protein
METQLSETNSFKKQVVVGTKQNIYKKKYLLYAPDH